MLFGKLPPSYHKTWRPATWSVFYIHYWEFPCSLYNRSCVSHKIIYYIYTFLILYQSLNDSALRAKCTFSPTANWTLLREISSRLWPYFIFGRTPTWSYNFVSFPVLSSSYLNPTFCISFLVTSPSDTGIVSRCCKNLLDFLREISNICTPSRFRVRPSEY